MARNDFNIGGISPNAYMGGAVRLNSDSFTNYYLNHKAQQDAQDEALTKYYGDLGKNLTPTGMHSNDITDLVKMKTDWQNFGTQNKKAIARPSLDGGKAYQQFNSMYNDMQGLIAESKEKVKNLSGLHPIVMDPAKRSRLPQNTIQAISDAELPVKHGYKALDPTSITFSDKPFDLNDQAKVSGLLGKIKPSESVASVVPDPKTGMQTVTYKNSYSPDQLNTITNIAHNLYHGHPGFKALVDQQLNPIDNDYDAHNEQFKKYFGRDINDGPDMATAHILGLNPNKDGRQVVQKTPVNPMNMLAAREASQKRLIDYRQASKDAKEIEAIGGVDNFMNDIETKAKAAGSHDYIHGDGTRDKAYDVGLTSKLLQDLFSKSSPNGKHKIMPDKVQIMSNGDYMPLFYQKGEDGNVQKSESGIALNEELSQPVSRTAVRAGLGNALLTKKTAERQLNSPASPAATPAPPKPTTVEKPKKQISGW